MLTFLDYLGTFAFAVSGALKAARCKMDLFGLAVLAFVTAIGGGTLRISVYDNERFFIAAMARSGASGTNQYTATFASGAPSNPYVWYTPVNYYEHRHRPLVIPLGTGLQESLWGVACKDGDNRPACILASGGIDARGQWTSIQRASNGFNLVARSNVNSAGEGQPFIFVATHRPVHDLQRYAEAVRITNNVIVDTDVPCGFSTWVAFGDGVRPTDVYVTADNMVNMRLKDYGYTLLQIDDGWQYGWRCSGSWWARSEWGGGNTDNDAMKTIADQIHARGLRAGLWMGVFNDEDNPDWRPTCWGHQYPQFDPDFRGDSRCPGNTGGNLNYHLGLDIFKTWLANLMQRVTGVGGNNWGFDYLKMDFLDQGNGTDLEYREACRILKDNMRAGTQVLHSNSKQMNVIGVLTAMRAGDDVSPRWSDGSAGIDPTLRGVSYQWYAHNNFWITDPDTVHIRVQSGGWGVTYTEAQSWATIAGLSGGILKMGDRFWDTTQVTADRLHFYKKIAPPYGVAAIPIDMFEHNSSSRDYPNFFVVPVKKPWGSYWVIGVFNWAGTAATKTVDFVKCFEVGAQEVFHIFDYWSDRYLGTHSGSLNVTLDSHACKLYAVVPRDVTRPQIVSTNRHISQGGVDLAAVNWDAGNKILTGTSTRLVTGVPYTMALSIPAGFTLQSATAGGVPMQVVAGTDNVTRVTITSPTAVTMNWVLNFGSGTVTDTTPPAQTTTLAVAGVGLSSVTLRWTAPGDDGNVGTAAQYDIRYATFAITNDATFNAAVQCTGEPAPLAAGAQQTFTVTGLTGVTTYYFAMKAADASGNWSPLSNVVSTRTANNPPRVNISEPADGTVMSLGSIARISASGLDDDGSVARMELYISPGSTAPVQLLAADNNPTISYLYSTSSTGTFVISARATDNAGATATASVTITVTALPVVLITQPVNGSTYTAPAGITLAATASDPDGTVVNVRFYQGNTLIGTDTATPYEGAWVGVSAGTYQLRAVAIDDQGATSTSTVVTVTVLSSSTPPVWYTLTTAVNPANSGSVNPASGTYLAGSQIQVTATPNANYTFSNWSGDATGNNPTITLTMDADKSIVANFSAVNSSPTVSITSPSDGATYTAPASITITATATDSDGGVAVVRFYSGATLLGADSTSPYEYTWNDVVAGVYFLTAHAEDDHGAVGTSGVIGVSVSSPVYYTLTVNANPSNGGTIAQSPTGTSHLAGTQVSLTATPNAGYEFAGWSGNITGSSTTNPMVVVMDGNKSITANFRAVQSPQPIQPVLQPGEVRVIGSAEGYINVAENPNVTIQFRRTLAGVVTVRVYDLRGRLVTEKNKDGQAGIDDIEWNVGTIAAGIYLMRINGPGIQCLRRCTVVK